MSRKQTPSLQKKAQTKPSGRSEELDEIIDRMPMAFGKWVALAVIVFAALFLLFGWIIKYPDMVTGQIKINCAEPDHKTCCQQYGEFAASFAQSTGGSEEGRVYSCRAKPCCYRGCTEDCGYNGQNQHGGCAITNIQRQLSR